MFMPRSGVAFVFPGSTSFVSKVTISAQSCLFIIVVAAFSNLLILSSSFGNPAGILAFCWVEGLRANFALFVSKVD